MQRLWPVRQVRLADQLMRQKLSSAASELSCCMQKHLALHVPDRLDPGSCCILWAELHHIAWSSSGRSQAQLIELQLQDVHGITVQSTMVTSYMSHSSQSMSFAARREVAQPI